MLFQTEDRTSELNEVRQAVGGKSMGEAFQARCRASMWAPRRAAVGMLAAQPDGHVARAREAERVRR